MTQITQITMPQMTQMTQITMPPQMTQMTQMETSIENRGILLLTLVGLLSAKKSLVETPRTVLLRYLRRYSKNLCHLRSSAAVFPSLRHLRPYFRVPTWVICGPV